MPRNVMSPDTPAPVTRSVIDSPVGKLEIACLEGKVCWVGMGEPKGGAKLEAFLHKHGINRPVVDDEKANASAGAQLKAYFKSSLRSFTVPVTMIGTPFQKKVWEETAKIPFGVVVSYGELAKRVGSPHASRAVGAALGQNPVGIIIPCHRVVGSDGKLTGYGGGIENKAALLKHEGV